MAEYVSAAVVQPVAPAYSYTYECSSELYLSGTTLMCTSDLNGYYNITDKIVIYQYLQRKNAAYDEAVFKLAADVNGDGHADLADAIAIRSYVISNS